ncbi:hypothetical protein [Acetivibrio ethanolgignens]|uniref:Uncharacterized protein n=1 Tax=Acetivibrio ethanolgignens TaxID=290052 RepID=A0A0V8QJW3_9FIRM|nr:hypothetical protein [Acetivibrio ethanolgignens]KSV60393.1 hypothetical protein ASU35_05385 [Acetivibrio ethanolgignens]
MDVKQEQETGLVVSEKGKGQSYNFTDQELIRQLVKSRMAQGQELEFEDLSGYELPPRTQFSMLSKPAVSIKYGKMTFNMASVRMFDEALFILTPVNRDKKRLMVVPCKEEESASLQWARIRESDDTKVNRTISSEEFILKLYKLMGWKLNCRYKILGRVALAKPGPMPVLIFDLEEAIMFDSKPMEFVDEETGEIKKKQVKYYPEEYKDCIGKSYNDYIEAKQMNIFEFLDEYTGQSYSDLPEEEIPDASAIEMQTYSNGTTDGEDGEMTVGSLDTSGVE